MGPVVAEFANAMDVPAFLFWKDAFNNGDEAFMQEVTGTSTWTVNSFVGHTFIARNGTDAKWSARVAPPFVITPGDEDDPSTGEVRKETYMIAGSRTPQGSIEL